MSMHAAASHTTCRRRSKRPHGITGSPFADAPAAALRQASLVRFDSFMRSLRNDSEVVVSGHAKAKSPLVHLDQLDLDGDRAARWCRRGMIEIEMGADRLFTGPIDVGDDRLDARPLDQPDEEAGGEYPRHHLELG
jgi:hypothetical protein